MAAASRARSADDDHGARRAAGPARATPRPTPRSGAWEAALAGGLTAGEDLTAAADAPLRSRPFDLVEHLYSARVSLARRLLWLLGVVIGAGVLMLVTARWTLLTADDVLDFVTMIFSAVMTLVGSAVGFYFGTDSRRR